MDDRLLAAARVVIEEQAGHGLEVSALVRRLGASSDALERIVEQLEADGAAVRVGDRLVAPAVLDAGRDHLLAALSTYHRDHPLSEGLPREEARERLFRHADGSVFERVLADLVAGDRIAARGHLALVSHRVSLSADEERARDAIAEAVRQGGLAPPDAAGLAALGGVDAAVGNRVVKLLIRQKVLVKVDALVFHAETLLRLKTEVSALKPEGSVEPVRVDVGTFKERYDITRKYAIPLLEFLDRERVTRRVGQGRVVL